MLNEDDTFRKLQQISFEEVYRLHSRLFIGNGRNDAWSITDEGNQSLHECGWTAVEYSEECRKRL